MKVVKLLVKVYLENNSLQSLHLPFVEIQVAK